MSVSLNPITQQRLDQFERRRRLVLTRGICAGLVTFVLLMTLIATADWLWVLPSSARWTMSLAGYMGTLLVVWLTSLRLLIRIPTRQELAQFVETTQPELREQLLSAIELCVDDPSTLHDSPIFRQLLQDRVGRQMETVNISSLLPLRLLARWVMASAGIVALFFLLLALPGFPFRQLMARAILPGVNLDRVSRIQVTILQPTPHSLMIPRDETVAVIVEISGGNVDEATLETRSSSGELLRQAMRVHGAGQFSANIVVEDESVDYRILAGDAVTRHYTIRSGQRPHVVAFHKTYRPPEYARLPATTLTESDGDLIALEGTEADIVFELDQPVSTAELRLERNGSDETVTIPLSPAEPLRYRAEVPITEPGVYRVHLVATQTGFDNPFSPKYEIRPEADLVPRVGLVGIDETTLILPPNDVLELAGLAEDDLPLVSLSQRISVNGRDWQTVPLTIKEEARVTVQWQWDMLDLGLKSGDQVTTKLAATDRMGNEGESIPLQILISSPDFDPDRHSVMELKGQLYDRLAELAESVAQHAEAAKTSITTLNGTPSLAEVPAANRSLLLDLANKIQEGADQATVLSLQILPKMPAGVDAEEVELVIRLLARIRYDHTRVAVTLLDPAGSSEKSIATGDDLKEVAAAFEKSADDCGQVHERYRELLAHDILAAAAGDLDAVRQYQSHLLESKIPLSWERLLRQETVVAGQLRGVEQLIRKHASRLPPRLQERVFQSVQWIGEWRFRLEESMESEDQLNRLRETAERLTAELPGQQYIATSDGNLPRTLLDARRELDKRSGSLSEPLQHLAEAASLLKTSTASLVETNDSVETRQLQTSIQRAAGKLQQLQGDGLARLSSRRTATQARTDADTQYASDAGLTRRALVALLSRLAEQPAEESEVPAVLGQIASAYHILEAGHGVIQLDKALGDLVSRERWESQEVSSRLDHPRRWDAVQDGCELVARALREAKYPQEVAGKIDQLRWSRPANEAGGKIGMRRWRHDQRVGAAYELAEMKTQLESALDDIQPIMEEARALIAKYAPTLPQMARQAAEELRELEEQTEATAEDLAGADEQTADEAMDRIEERKEEVNLELDDLLDALAEDAARQDLLTEEGRERARDADDSTRMIEEPATQMNRAMEQAAAAREPEQQARNLSQAADQQEQTADALDKVADHYERLETGAEVAETRQVLRQAEREMGVARALDQQYSGAEQLGELAAKSPQDLMAELEAELAQNPAMQEALSEISKDALAQAKNSLQRSAERETEMERSVERSDQDFREKKQILAEELRELGRTASELANRQASQAESLAANGKDPEAREQLERAKNQLSQEVARARNADQDAAMEDLLALARQTAQQATEAAQKLRQGEQATAKSKDAKIHDNEDRRAEHQRQFEDNQKRFHEQLLREARDRSRERERNQQRADEQVNREQRELDKVQQDLTRQRESLNRKPEDPSAQRGVREAEQRQQQAQRELEQAQRALERAKNQREEAETTVQQLEKKELPRLGAPNPAAELANRHAREAAEMAEQMANRAGELAQKPDWADALAPQHDTLNQAREQQAEIGVDVEQVAEDVARAGRHESRLGKADLSRHLTEKAQDIEAVAKGEVAQSERELQEAAEQTDPQKALPQDNEQALEAHASIGEAEEAISAQAQALDATLNPPETAAQTAAATPTGDSQSPSEGGSAGQQATPEQAARAQMLARTLDELDQAMAGSPATPSEPGGSQPPPSTLAGAAQAQASQMAQGRMQARMPARMPGREGAVESQLGAALVDQGGASAGLQPVARMGDDWGKLRAQSADDTVGSGHDAVSAEYRKQVETYFRVIAERARKKE